MQRAGNSVFRVLAVPLRAEVFPLYQAHTKLSVCCPRSQNSAKYSIDANVKDLVKDWNPLPSQCHTTTSLVAQFSHLSAVHNPRVEEEDLPDLSPLADALEANLTLLTFDQLQDLVYALTLWPEARRTSTTLKQVSEIIIWSGLDLGVVVNIFDSSIYLFRCPTNWRSR